MPFFKSTKEIFSPNLGLDVFNENWMDKNKVYLPPKRMWDYKKELSIEDVDIWEVIYESGGFYGLYASWSPYAEFYMILYGWNYETGSVNIETYYGKLANEKVIKKAKSLGFPISINSVWAEKENMWLYTN